MKKVIYKLFWIWQYDKQEEWLNKMAGEGWALTAIGLGRYEFEKCSPGEYQIRLELLKDSPSSEESQQYISFLEETGIEHIGSVLKWAYFRKKTEEGAFELYSDKNSRIQYLTRTIHFISGVLIFNLCVGCLNLFFCFLSHSPLNAIGIINIVICIVGGISWSRLLKKREKLYKNDEIL